MKNLNLNQKTKYLALASLSIAVLALGYVIIRGISDKPRVKLEGLEAISYEEAVKSGLATKADKQVVSISLSVDVRDKAKISIADIKSYKNGVPMLSSSGSNSDGYDYTVEVIKDGEQVYTDYFSAPTEVISESVDTETGNFKREESINTTIMPLTLPWFGENAEVVIKDVEGKVLVQKSLKGISVEDNKPGYTVWR